MSHWTVPVEVKNQPIEVTQKALARNSIKDLEIRIRPGYTASIEYSPDPGKKWLVLSAILSVSGTFATFQVARHDPGVKVIFQQDFTPAMTSAQVDFMSSTVIVRHSDYIMLGSSSDQSYMFVRVSEDNDF